MERQLRLLASLAAGNRGRTRAVWIGPSRRQRSLLTHGFVQMRPTLGVAGGDGEQHRIVVVLKFRPRRGPGDRRQRRPPNRSSHDRIRLFTTPEPTSPMPRLRSPDARTSHAVR